MNAHKGLFQGADVAGDLADPKPTSVGPVQCGTRVSGDRGCSCVADQGARSDQGDPRGACVGADRGAESGCHCVADEAGDR